MLAEDDGLYIDCLGGFPGPYSAYVQGTIGNEGILRLVGSERGAAFRSAVAYRDDTGGAVFAGEVRGEIAGDQRGKGWGYDPVFVPEGGATTFAEMDGKDAVSHRYRALSSFAAWFGERGAAAGPAS
ncbi:xanthosine triphosphate pyrophosphatase [Cenarchaeum symbiosum A]|uniref:Xanthosine triphosphate pyrophosphatase n=1 Tax=Cenarchaeum symbiosum (strain A) TaxID=414004 RepID=A0RY41_CENSY|nr:xanthosine triphosphate pyrophosphatase [Cenarchaeum symbiosum A]